VRADGRNPRPWCRAVGPGRACRYSTAALDRALGLLLLTLYIVGVVGLAALMTFATVKLFPTQRTPKKPPEDGQGDGKPKQKASPGEAGGGGRLYRRAKRGAA
jgi:hypothetical protein